MTRFARAKGSKASNERLPEQATPWSVMRTHLHQDVDRQEDASERAKFEERRKQNYENFLKERAAEKTEKTWCEFEESEQSNKSKIANSKISKKKNRHNLSTESSVNAKKTNSDDDIDENDEEIDKWINENADEETDGKFANLTSQLDNILKTKPKNKNDKTKNKTNSESSFTITNVDKSDESNLSKKKKKRKRDEASVDNDEANCADVLEKIKKTDDARDVSENKNKINKNKSKTMILDNLEKIVEDISANNEESKPNNKKNKKNKKSNNIDENPKIDESKQEIASDIPKIKKDKKNKQNKAMNPIDFNQKNESKAGEKSKNKFNTPNNKNNKNSEIKRRKPEIEKSILIVNGEELEVSNFDGFPILTKDAERLQDLRKNLISKGIPRSEVMRTMKLERRRAEKALSRMKKKLCFHCRKGGHNLSECPELAQKNDMGAPSSGICFKCGSTEHTHFACKVVRTQDFKFAQCFICKEQGHISRQCPDNPRGLYPKGGGCRECGDVTHLKKDCPKIVQEKEDTSIKLDLMDHKNIEDDNDNKSSKQNIQNSSIKRIKF